MYLRVAMDSAFSARLRQYAIKYLHCKWFPPADVVHNRLSVILHGLRHPARSLALYKKYLHQSEGDGLCEECAKYDWEYFLHRHLDPALDGFRIQVR